MDQEDVVYILGHKMSQKFKNIDIISNIFSDHNNMKLEINHRGGKREKTITWRLMNILPKLPQ